MEQKITKESVLAGLLLLLVMLSFFWRGMYFEGDQFLYLILLGVLGAAAFLWIPSSRGIYGGLDWFVIAITAVSFLSAIRAVYFRSAVLEGMKYAGCLTIYFLAKRLLSDKRDWVLAALYLAGVIMSAVGLGAAAGVYEITGSYDVKKNLVTSLFQYHNTSALMMACTFLFGMKLYGKTKRRLLRFGIYAGNMIAFLTVVFSQSRGTWLLFPAMLALYVWLMPRGEKTRWLPLVGCLIGVLPFLKLIGDALAERSAGMAVLWMICSLLLAVTLCAGIERIPSFTLKKKNIWILLAVLLAFFLLFGIFAQALLPESILNRISTFTKDSRTVTERLTFYKDTFTIFKTAPVMGHGGGSWPFLYPAYQSYWYRSNSPHSFLLSLMVESGVLGIAVFLLLTGIMLLLLRKLLRAEPGLRSEFAVFFTAAAVIFLHSMFDIDMAFYTVTTVTWLILAMLSPLEGEGTVKCGWLRWAAAVGCLLLVCGGIVGKMAWNQYYKTASYLNSDAEKAYESASGAVGLDPKNSAYCLTKGNIAFHIATGLAQSDPDRMYVYADEAREAFEQGYQSNPRDHMLVSEMATFYVNVGEFDLACQRADELTKLRPLDPETYMTIAQVYTSVAQQYQKEDNRDGIKQAMSRLISLEDEIAAVEKEHHVKLWIYTPTNDAIAQAKKIMEQIEQLEEKQ